MTSAVRTLLALFGEPLPDAVSARQLGATRTKHCVLNFAVANKTFEYLINILICITLRFFTHLPNGGRAKHTIASIHVVIIVIGAATINLHVLHHSSL